MKLRDWQLFLKRTRKRTRVKVCASPEAEYGELGLRPHYHGLFFNYDFPDKKLLRKRNGHPVYSSELLSETLGEQGVDRAWFGDARQRGLRGALLDEEGDRQEGR